MQFSVGDQVVHPKYGAGEITARQCMEIEEDLTEYYVVEFPNQRLVVRVPVKSAEELGLRPVMSPAKLARLVNTLCSIPRLLSKDHVKRQTSIREKLKTGHPLRLAEAIRDLTWRKAEAKLSKTDEFLLNQGRDFLAGELATVTNTDTVEARQIIDSALDKALAYDSIRPEKTG